MAQMYISTSSPRIQDNDGLKSEHLASLIVPNVCPLSVSRCTCGTQWHCFFASITLTQLPHSRQWVQQTTDFTKNNSIINPLWSATSTKAYMNVHKFMFKFKDVLGEAATQGAEVHCSDWARVHSMGKGQTTSIAIHPILFLNSIDEGCSSSSPCSHSPIPPLLSLPFTFCLSSLSSPKNRGMASNL